MHSYTYTFSVDNDLKIRTWDRTLEQVRNRSAAEAIGVPYYELLPRIGDRADDAVSRAMDENRTLVIKGYRTDCYLGSATTDITVAPRHDEAGRVIGAEIIAESHPECSLARTMELSQPLIDIGKMSSTLAHGIRNPLNAIKGAVVYLNQKYSSEPTLVEFANIIQEEIAKLDTFITKFLSGSLEVTEKIDIDLDALLERIVTLTGFQAKARGITLVPALTPLPPVKGDAHQLESAVLNILNNAVEAMPGGGTITIATEKTEFQGREFVVVRISDNGPGITEEAIDRIEEPGGGGTRGRGFGLFITREIVQLHGGHLEITSEKGEGTTVQIHLPLTGDTE